MSQASAASVYNRSQRDSEGVKSSESTEMFTSHLGIYKVNYRVYLMRGALKRMNEVMLAGF